MSVLVVGGDNLGSITHNLKLKGFDCINHITGRKKTDKKLNIPNNTDLILVLIDYAGHQMIKNIKEKTKDTSSKIVYAKRSWVSVEKSIEEFMSK